MFDYVIPAFVTLFVIIDPIGLVPIFLALTNGGSVAYKRRMAVNGALIGFLILLVFALAGKPLLAALGISLAAFRISGGALLFLIALEMVFEKRNKKRSERAEERHDELLAQHSLEQPPAARHFVEEPDDIAAFPLAMPFIAGPGAIATIMLLMSEHHDDWIAQALIIATMAVVVLIALVLFIISGAAARYLAPSVTTVISRLLGMLLAALSIQFVIDGLKTAFKL